MNHHYQYDPQHQMMLRSIQRLGDLGNIQSSVPQIECPHCYVTFDSDHFNDHIALDHPQYGQLNHSQVMNHGIPRSYSQSTLQGNP